MPDKNSLVLAQSELFDSEDVVDMDGGEWVAFQGVTFKKDFGPWAAGDKVEYLSIRWDQGKITEDDENGDPTGKSCDISVSISAK